MREEVAVDVDAENLEFKTETEVMGDSVGWNSCESYSYSILIIYLSIWCISRAVLKRSRIREEIKIICEGTRNMDYAYTFAKYIANNSLSQTIIHLTYTRNYAAKNINCLVFFNNSENSTKGGRERQRERTL